MLQVIVGRSRFVNPFFETKLQQINNTCKVRPIKWLPPNGFSFNAGKNNNEFLQWLWQKILSQILSFTFKLLGKAF
jgi:hypothetical protein